MTEHEGTAEPRDADRSRRRPGRPRDPRGEGVRPEAELDSTHDVVVRGGEIAEISDSGQGEGARRRRGGRRARACCSCPAFVDPHVHLRAPGQEHKEDIETGTRAAAAGGYCAVVAMANTEPPIDSAAVLGSVREIARGGGVDPGRLRRQRHPRDGRRGADRDGGAARRRRGRLLRRRPARRAARGCCAARSSTSALAGGVIALHEEDPELSGDGVMHEGEVSAMLGLAGIPSVSESTMIARDCALALYEGARIHVQHLSARRIGRGDRRAPRTPASRSPARRPRITSSSPTRPSAASTPASR